MRKPRVLFLCTGNSARSQMAEGLLRKTAGDRFDVVSAGVEPAGLNPLAVEVMAEIGIDISHHRSKHAREFLGHGFPYLITVCDQANEKCPIFPGVVYRAHWSFEDPAKATGTGAQKLAVFRRVRDEIRSRIEAFAKDPRGAEISAEAASPVPL
ncbi:MAG TPA: arsenate reductase ArsC [Thermoanaerobaculia bacterium]|nr:arsenate reductase ArsC [Thermoanaerobaculia bacterium]